MGTRNITWIRKDGELRACQYGQWDGYPTGAGAHILEFVASSDMDAFADKVAACTLANPSGTPGAEVYCTGAPVTDDVEEVFGEHARLAYREPASPEDYGEKTRRVEESLLAEFGPGRYAAYLVATRDTGYRILDVIDRYAPLALFCDDYLLMEECDWQIEAISEVDLDARTVRLNFHDHVREYTFSEARGMDIDSEMEAFEAEVLGCPEEGDAA